MKGEVPLMPDSKKYHVSLEDIDKWNSLVDELAKLKKRVDDLSGGVTPQPPTPCRFITAFKHGNHIVGDESKTIPIEKLNTTNGTVKKVIIGPFRAIKVKDVYLGFPDNPNKKYLMGIKHQNVMVGSDTEPVSEISSNGVKVTGPFDAVKVGSVTINME